MRFLYVCADLGIPVLGRKGAAVHLRSLVAALARAGHEVTLAAAATLKETRDEPAALAATLLHLPPAHSEAVEAVKGLEELAGTDGGAAADLKRILHARAMTRELLARLGFRDFDAVYERAALYSTAGVEIAAAFDIPHLLEVNAPLADEQARYRTGGLPAVAAATERWVWRHADAVLPVSRVLRDEVVSQGVPEARVRVIPNGVDAELFQPRPARPEVRQRWDLGVGPLLGFVGGLRAWHGAQSLPPLLERLVARHPGLKLVVVGDGPMRGELVADLGARGLAGRAVLTGALPQEEVAAVLNEVSIALAPYPRVEHAFYFSPLKLFEYLAAGRAVVASDSGQIGEVLRDGENGLLVPPGDLDALAAACDRLLGDAALRERLGRAARSYAEKRTWDVCAREVVLAAEDALRRRAAA